MSLKEFDEVCAGLRGGEKHSRTDYYYRTPMTTSCDAKCCCAAACSRDFCSSHGYCLSMTLVFAANTFSVTPPCDTVLALRRRSMRRWILANPQTRDPAVEQRTSI